MIPEAHNLFNYRSAFAYGVGRVLLFKPAILAGQQAKAYGHPLGNPNLDRIRVDPALPGDKQLNRAGTPFKSDAAFDFVAGLIAPVAANRPTCGRTFTSLRTPASSSQE